MKRTIYLNDELARRVDEYLRDHPEATFSSVVQQAIVRNLAPPDSTAILELAGLVRHASAHAGDHAEDRRVLAER